MSLGCFLAGHSSVRALDENSAIPASHNYHFRQRQSPPSNSAQTSIFTPNAFFFNPKAGRAGQSSTSTSISTGGASRGAPPIGFAILILRMRSRTSCDTVGPSGQRILISHVQSRRDLFRCQPMTVSGLTITSADCQPDHVLASHTRNRRSARRSCTRPLWFRRKTFH